MATNITANVRTLAETRRAFVDWVQQRCDEAEQLLTNDLSASPRYYFFEQSSSQYATEFFNRVDRWRRWRSALLTGLHRRIRHAEHLVEDAAARFNETRLLVFTIRDFNSPTLTKQFDLRDHALVSNGTGWIDIREWFGRGREEPTWDQVRQTLLMEVRRFAAMVSEQADELQLLAGETETARPSASAAASSPPVVDQSSRFTELEARGEGAHASVWKARDLQMSRVVALRVVQPSAGGDEEAIAHARTMAKPPQHPNIVTVYELVSINHPVERRPVIAAVMEFVDGDKLRNVCKRQLSSADALRLCAGILTALGHYHEHGFAHLDLHASNVLVTKSMDVKIIDPKTYRTEMFATTQHVRDQIAQDVRNAMFLLREILTKSELSMEVAVRLDEAASSAVSVDELQASLAVAIAAPSRERKKEGSDVSQPRANVGPLPDIADASGVLSAALGLVRANDQIGWRQLEDHLRRQFVERLHIWRAEVQWPGDDDKEGAFAAADKLLEVSMGRLVFALAGVYSGNSALGDQRHVIDDLLSVPGWSVDGVTAIVEAPRALVFLLHYIHGALCLVRRQPDLALQFADVTVSHRHNQAVPLWAEPDFCERPKLLTGSSLPGWAWEYLCSMRKRWTILERFFALPSDYDIGLASYSMMLSLQELASNAAEFVTAQHIEATGGVIPPLFLTMSHETIAAASKRTFENRLLVEPIAKRFGTTPDAMRLWWPTWKGAIVKLGRRVLGQQRWLGNIPLGDLA